MTEPVRTCIGCRRRAPAAELIRVVARADPDGTITVVVDGDHRLPGRGAWLHPGSECADRARQRGAFARALRIRGAIEDSLR